MRREHPYTHLSRYPNTDHGGLAMKKHYTRTLPDGGFKCCACRQVFKDSKTLARHYGRDRKCKHPLQLGLTIDLSLSPWHWDKPGKAA